MTMSSGEIAVGKWVESAIFSAIACTLACLYATQLVRVIRATALLTQRTAAPQPPSSGKWRRDSSVLRFVSGLGATLANRMRWVGCGGDCRCPERTASSATSGTPRTAITADALAAQFKSVIIACGSLATILVGLIRAFDPSAAFGLLSPATVETLHDLTTAFCVDAFAEIAFTTTRAAMRIFAAEPKPSAAGTSVAVMFGDMPVSAVECGPSSPTTRTDADDEGGGIGSRWLQAIRLPQMQSMSSPSPRSSLHAKHSPPMSQKTATTAATLAVSTASDVVEAGAHQRFSRIQTMGFQLGCLCIANHVTSATCDILLVYGVDDRAVQVARDSAFATFVLVLLYVHVRSFLRLRTLIAEARRNARTMLASQRGTGNTGTTDEDVLARALSKLTWLTRVMYPVSAAVAIYTIYSSLDMLLSRLGGHRAAVYSLSPASSYSPLAMLMTWVQQLCLGVLLCYVWLPAPSSVTSRFVSAFPAAAITPMAMTPRRTKHIRTIKRRTLTPLAAPAIVVDAATGSATGAGLALPVVGGPTQTPPPSLTVVIITPPEALVDRRLGDRVGRGSVMSIQLPQTLVLPDIPTSPLSVARQPQQRRPSLPPLSSPRPRLPGAPDQHGDGSDTDVTDHADSDDEEVHAINCRAATAAAAAATTDHATRQMSSPSFPDVILRPSCPAPPPPSPQSPE